MKMNWIFSRRLTEKIKIPFTSLIVFFVLFFLCSCDMFNSPMRNYLRYWTETAIIQSHEFDEQFPVTRKDQVDFVNIRGGTGRKIKYYLVNPQNYTFEIDVEFNEEIQEKIQSAVYGTDYTIEQPEDDKSVLWLTLNKTFVEKCDGSGLDLSPVVSITETDSKRRFHNYLLPCLINSPPATVWNQTVLRTPDSSAEAADSEFVVVFNLPDMTGKDRDIEKIRITGASFNEEFDVDVNSRTVVDKNSLVVSSYDSTWSTAGTMKYPFEGDTGNNFAGIKTGVLVSATGGDVSFTITVTDSRGLTSTCEASTSIEKLEQVECSHTDGEFDEGETVTFTANSAVEDTIVHVLIKGDDDIDGMEYTAVSSYTHTFNDDGNYKITAWATKSGYASSQTTERNFKVLPILPPVIEGNDAEPFDEGDSVTFTAQNENTEIHILIKGENDAEGTEYFAESPYTYTFNDEGTYTVTSWVKKSDEVKSEDVEFKLTVNPILPPVIEGNDAAPFDEGDSVTFTAQNENTEIHILIKGENDAAGTEYSGESPYTYTFNDEGTYTVTSWVKKSDEVKSEDVEFKLTVNPILAPVITMDSEPLADEGDGIIRYMAGLNVKFEAQNKNTVVCVTVNGEEYSGLSPYTHEFNYVADGAGSEYTDYEVTAWVKKSDEVKSVDTTLKFRIIPLGGGLEVDDGFDDGIDDNTGTSVLSAVYDKANNSISVTGIPDGAESVSVSVQGQELTQIGTDYKWTLPEGMDTGTWTFTVKYMINGSSYRHNFTVNLSSEIPKTDIASGAQFDEGDSVTFAVYDAETTVHVKVEKEDGTATEYEGTPSYTHTFNEEGKYTVTAWSSKDGYDDSETITRTYTVNPILPVQSSLPIDSEFAAGGEVTFTAQNENVTIHILVNGVEVYAKEGPYTHKFVDAGSYTVTTYAKKSDVVKSEEKQYLYEVTPIGIGVGDGSSENQVSLEVKYDAQSNSITITGIPDGAENISVSSQGSALESVEGSTNQWKIPSGLELESLEIQISYSVDGENHSATETISLVSN